MLESDKVYPDNVFTVWSVSFCLRDNLALPSSVVTAIERMMSVCEPYIENGFTFEFLPDA